MRYQCAVLLRKPYSSSVKKAAMQIFTQYTYLPRHILTDKGSALTSQALKNLKEASGIHIEHAIIKHDQTIGMIERSHKNSSKYSKSTSKISQRSGTGT